MPRIAYVEPGSITLRLAIPPDVYDAIIESAKRSSRPYTLEVIHRLRESFGLVKKDEAGNGIR